MKIPPTSRFLPELSRLLAYALPASAAAPASRPPNAAGLRLGAPFARGVALLFATLALLNPFTQASAAARLPSIYAFNVAAEATINLGATTSLNWSVGDATSVTLEPGFGDVTNQTSIDISPTATTTYILTAKNSAGSVTKSKKITVIAPPVFQSLAATPDAINAGGSSTLSWSAPGASYFTVTADQGADPGNVFANSVVVRPKATTTYTVVAVNTAGTDTKTITLSVTAPLAKPSITSFTASPTAVAAGDSTTLSWAVNGATSLSIAPGVGAVSGTSVSITPAATTSYTLTATNASGSVTKKVSVTVTAAAPAPVINTFTATPTTIVAGGSSSLAWSATGATSFTLTADTGASPGLVTGNSISVSPTATTAYTLAAINDSGSARKTVTIVVTNPLPPPAILLFAASPTTIPLGGNSSLSWSATGATSLKIASDIGASPGAVTGASGTVSVSPTAATNYTLTATNDSGSVTKTVKVTVNDPAPAIGSFVSIPNTINAGETARIIWSVTGAATLNITASHGPSPGVVTGASGSIDLSPVVSTDYTLTATSPGGVVSHSLTEIVVNAAPPLPVPVIASFEASPDEISLGASTTLNWSISAADSISIAADHGASPGAVTGTSVSVSPLVDTVYTITATNTFGDATDSVTVTVHGPAAPAIGSFFASPAFIQVGSPATLNWSVSGADSIAITADHGASPGAVTGTSLVVNPSETTLYTLTATNTIGQTTALAPVTIFTSGGAGTVMHPRIWVTAATLPALSQRVANNDPAWLKLRNECDALVNLTIRFPDQDPVSNSINGGYEFNDYLLPSTELALGYLVAKTADPVRAQRYAAKEKQLLLALSDPIHHGRPTTDDGYPIRSYVPALALGYDWIYETLSDADRAQIFTEINRWVVSFDNTGFGRDFPQGNYFAGYYCAKALGALATEGDNPSAAAMWDDWLNRLHYGMVQPYHAAWLSGGGAPDGWNYGPFETINMLRPIAAALTAKGLDLIHDAAKPMAYFDGHARWMTQFTWPNLKTVSDRGFVYEGDNPTSTDSNWATQYNGLLQLAHGDNAPLMQRYTLDIRGVQGTGDIDPWVEFLLQNSAAPIADYRIPLSYRTPGDGQVAMRSAWTPDAVWATFQSGPLTNYPGSAEELFDQGSLAIMHGDVQFLVNPWAAMFRHTPGTTDGNPVFNDVYNEVFSTQTDGIHSGRRIFNTYYAVRPAGYWGQAGNTPFDHSTTTLARFEEGGSYVLMRGTHLENQYADDHPITGWTRTVVYVRPQLFIAYDRTSVNNASTDNWLAWHVGPTPRERSDAAAGTHAFDVTDTRAAFGGNLFRGRVTTVLPAGNLVNNVDVFGRGKVSRLEVRSASPVLAATWLTVLDASASAAAASSAAPLSSAAGNVLAGAIEGTIVSSVTGNNVAVFFSKAGTALTGAIGLSLPAHDTLCLATDLAPNTGYAVTATLANGQLTVQFAPGGAFTTTAQGSLALNVSAAGVVTTP